MGRYPTKATGNRYYESRIEAAKKDDRLSSRDKAGHLLGVSEASMTDYEQGQTRVPVDVVMRMSDLYNDPSLTNYCCLHECPIGQRHSLSDEVVEIDRVTLKLLKRLRVEQLEEIKKKLVDIAEDGIISEDEKPDMTEIMEFLDDLAKTISEIQVAGEKALRQFRGDER